MTGSESRRSAARASVVAARKSICVSGGVRGPGSLRQEREGERRKAPLGNRRGLFPRIAGKQRHTATPLDVPSRRSFSLGPLFEGTGGKREPADHDGFPAVTCTSPSHL